MEAIQVVADAQAPFFQWVIKQALHIAEKAGIWKRDLLDPINEMPFAGISICQERDVGTE